jgi:hypothetical protein
VQFLRYRIDNEADVMLTVHVEYGDKGSPEKQVDEALYEFDEYFKTIQTDSAYLGLTGPERAIIKTFCAYMLGIGPNNPRNSPPTKRSEHA